MKKFFLIILFSCSPIVFAANSYKISIIVFKHITPQNLRAEIWENVLKTPYLKGSIDLLHGADSSFQLLSNDQFGLKKEFKKLNSQSDYKVLFYASWIQDFSKPSRWLNIYNGDVFDSSGNVIADANSGADNSDVVKKYQEFNGIIKITNSQYFNTNLRLYLTEPEALIGLSQDNDKFGEFQPVPLVTFTLKENRKLKLNDLNYFDHPLFGALIKIEPQGKNQ